MTENYRLSLLLMGGAPVIFFVFWSLFMFCLGEGVGGGGGGGEGLHSRASVCSCVCVALSKALLKMRCIFHLIFCFESHFCLKLF